MKRLIVLFTLMLGVNVQANIGQGASINVYTPVNGLYVVLGNVQVGSPDNMILVSDISNAIVTPYMVSRRAINYPIWANTSNNLALYAFDANFSPDGGGIDILDDSFNLIARPIEQSVILFPMSWSQDDTSLLFTYYSLGDIALRILDLNTGNVNTIFESPSDIPLDFTVAHIPNAISLREEEIRYSDQNPLFPDWFITQIEVTYTTSEESDIRYRLPFTFLHDAYLNNVIPLNDLFDDSIHVYKSMWSSNGRHIYVHTTNNQLYILTFNTLTLDLEIHNVVVPPNRVVVDWLDISDLLLVTSGRTFYIAQISDGELHLQDFFSFDLSNSDIFSIGRGDWKFTGTPEEAAEISCIFDETLPTRLEIGVQAQVTFTDGTPSRLRSEPSTWGDVVQSLPEGTVFEIIGGYMCGSGYRWWQVQLADGTQGWIAEASETEYWIERRAS